MATKNLTKANVEALSYNLDGPSRQVLWDAKQRGFGCRVTPEGGKSYVILYRANGRQRLMSLGRIEDFTGVEEARAKAQSYLHDLRQKSVDPMAARERMAEAKSMAELWKVYDSEHLSRMSENTQRATRSVWSVHLAPIVEALKPGQVTRADVIRMHDKASAAGKVVANRAVQRLRAMLGWLQERNPRQFPENWRNPASKVKLHKEHERKEILDLGQQQALVQAVADEPDPWVRAYLQVMLLTGLRAKKELAALRWADVDLERAELRIRKRKNGEDLIVPLPPVAVELLRSVPAVADNPFVFPSARRAAQPLTTNMIRRRYNAALKRAKLPHRTLHDLRRSLGTNLARSGASTKQISWLLGNTSEVTARVYVQLAANDLRRLSEQNAQTVLPAPSAQS